MDSSDSMASLEDCYQTLGVPRDANFVQIKKAHNALALKFHPDKNPNGHKKFLVVRDAYEQLKELFEEFSDGKSAK